MRRWNLAVVICVSIAISAAAASAGEAGGEEGIAALERFLTVAPLGEGEVILGLAGFHGKPSPEKWLILIGFEGRSGFLREVVFSRGRVESERSVSPLPGQDLPHLPIRRESVRIDSSEAFRIAGDRARSRHLDFAAAHFQLRVRDDGKEPVWMVSLLKTAQVQVGLVYLSASTGEVLRETWRSATPATGASPDRANVSSRLLTQK